MVQSRTGTGKTAAFGLPSREDRPDAPKRAGADPRADARARAAGRARADAARQAPRHRRRADLRRRADGQADRAAARRRAGRRRHAGPRARSPRPRHARLQTVVDVRARRVRRDAVDGLPRGHRARRRALPDKRQTLLFSATMPDEVERYRAPPHARRPSSSRCRATLVGRRHPPRVLHRQRHRAQPRPLEDHLRRGAGERDHLLQHARGDDDGRRVPAQAGARRRAAARAI